MSILGTETRIKRRKFARKYEALAFTLIAVVTIVIALVFAGLTIWKYFSLNQQSERLSNLIYQDTEDFKEGKETATLLPSRNSIDDMIASLETVRQEKEGYETYQGLLNNPYKYFLQYIYLPRLNIWQNPYTQEVDTTLIGSKFLQENPYTDLALINTWTRIFEDVGDTARDAGINAANQVKDIEIKKIKELDNGYFSIPLTLNFESADRRSFLLLMDKLALSSHQGNISLINEFFFYVRENIKKEYTTELDTLVINNEALSNEKNIDKKLGYLFDQRVHHGSNDFVAQLAQQKGLGAKNFDQIIEESIRSAAGCSNQSTDECHYLFREKFRTLPYLIYPITNNRKSKSLVLKEFFAFTVPPIIKINEFTFDEITKQRNTVSNAKFQGKIDIEVFGRGISNNELETITSTLGVKCLGQGFSLTPQIALDVLKENIIQMSKINTLNTERASQLFELQSIVEQLNTDYPAQSQYNKIIKAFELFRMFSDASVCTVN